MIHLVTLLLVSSFNMKLEATMKKMLLLTLGLLALGVTVASAQGTISLAYGVCRVAATLNADDFVWPNSNPNCTDPLNTGSSAVMVSAWKNAATIANFSLATTILDIQVGAGGGLSDFWTFDPGTCHEGGLSAAGGIGTGGAALPANCGNPYGAVSGQNNAFGSFSSPALGRIHWENDHGKNTPTAALVVPAATGGYVGNVISLGWDDAAVDGGTCAGCQDPACIVLNGVKVYNSNGILAADISGVTPGVKNFVTFYGGAGTCPGATPTKSATWGQVKALYR